MFKWLQQRLGITQTYDRVGYVDNRIMALERKLDALHNRLGVTDRGIGRMIAKLDPDYGRSEFSAERRAESDRIGDEVMRKITGEYLASKTPNA